MEGGAAERDELLRRQMKVMPPARFEQLVLELAQREFPDVRRLQHPDGGADVLRPGTAERKAEVWQAKRYGDSINWEECENSLTSAMKRWRPSKIIFCFARDLSQQLEDSFETKLVKHPNAQREGVEVTVWNQSELVRRLDENDDLKPRFFGPEQDALVTKLDRMVKAGGKLESAGDLVERARTLSQFAERDVDFTYAVLSSPAEAPAPEWPKLPYLKMEVVGAEGRVEVTAWARESAEVELPSFHFTDDEAGQQARAEALGAWALGHEAIIGEGARLRLQPPQVMKELLPNPSVLSTGTIRIPAAEPFEAELEVETADEELSHRFEVRPIPPRPGAFGALAGYIGETLVEVNFALLDEKHSSATFSLSSHFGPNARSSLEAARLIHAWCRHERLTFRSDELYPDGISGRSEEVRQNERCAEMEWRARFYGDVVFLEEQLARALPMPDEMTVEAMDAVGTAAAVLRTGEGTATFTRAEGFVQNPREIPRLPEEFRKQGATQRMVTYPIFGEEIELGLADYELPPLKVVDIVPHGSTPDAPARVVLEAEGDGQMRFRLVDWEPPAEDNEELEPDRGSESQAPAPE